MEGEYWYHAGSGVRQDRRERRAMFADRLAGVMRQQTDRGFAVGEGKRMLGERQTPSDAVKPDASVAIDQRFNHIALGQRLSDRWT